MSWDSKALVVLTATWAVLAVVYASIIGMMTGARGWGVGALIFLALLLSLRHAERQGARRALTGASRPPCEEVQETSGSPHSG